MKNFMEFLNHVLIVAGWDVVRQARRPFFFVSRMALAGVVSIQVIWLWAIYFSQSQGSEDQMPSTIIYRVQSIFGSSLFIMSVGIVLLCPALTAGAIAGDRERKIWYDLMNSPLSGWSIVLGKMCGRLATVFAWILVVLPVWAILGLVGGLDPKHVLFSFMTLFFYGWLYAAIGLFASVMTSRTRDALGLATSIVILLLIAPAVGEFLKELVDSMAILSITDYTRMLVIFNPFITTPFGPNGKMSYEYPVIFTIILSGPILTWICGILLRPVSQHLENKTVQKTGQSKDHVNDPQRKDAYHKSDRNYRYIPFLYSPLAIKERSVRSGSRLGRFMKNAVILLVLSVGGFYLLTEFLDAMQETNQYGINSSSRSERDEFRIVVCIISGTAHCVFMYAFMIGASSRILSEKESDTWLTLLSTPVEASEILISKAIATVWEWRLSIAFILISWLLASISIAINPINIVITAMIWSVQLVFFLVLGLRFGLTSKSFQSAALKSIGTWILLQIMIPLLCLSIFQLEDVTAAIQPTFLAITPLIYAESSKPVITALILTGLIMILTMTFSSLLIYNSLCLNFNKLTDRTQDKPDVSV